MEFPRHLHKAGGLFVVCPDEDTYHQLHARGWALLPTEHVETPQPVSVFDALAEPAGDVAPVGDEPKKRGRKPKAE